MEVYPKVRKKEGYYRKVLKLQPVKLSVERSIEKYQSLVSECFTVGTVHPYQRLRAGVSTREKPISNWMGRKEGTKGRKSENGKYGEVLSIRVKSSNTASITEMEGKGD